MGKEDRLRAVELLCMSDGLDEEETNETVHVSFLFCRKIMKHFVKKLWTQGKCRCFLLLEESER